MKFGNEMNDELRRRSTDLKPVSTADELSELIMRLTKLMDRVVAESPDQEQAMIYARESQHLLIAMLEGLRQ